MSDKLLTKHDLEFISLERGYTGLYESTLVKMPYCRKSHVAAKIVKLLHRYKIALSLKYYYCFNINTLTLSFLLLSSADNLCKQLGSRSGQLDITLALIRIHTVKHSVSVPK